MCFNFNHNLFTSHLQNVSKKKENILLFVVTTDRLCLGLGLDWIGCCYLSWTLLGKRVMVLLAFCIHKIQNSVCWAFVVRAPYKRSTPKVACIMCLWVWLKVLPGSLPLTSLSCFVYYPSLSLSLSASQTLAVVAVVGLQSRPAHAVRSTKAKNPEKIICWQPWKWSECSLLSIEILGRLQLRHFTPLTSPQIEFNSRVLERKKKKNWI